MNTEQLFSVILNELDSNEGFILKREAQNSDYEGFLLQINDMIYRTRRAKLTPKKKGYFVACWEKNSEGTNEAYSCEDAPEKLIISIIDGEKRGQFIFPKTVLFKKGILRNTKQKGKMAFRVYPSWVTDLNDTARKTQKWQLAHFIDLTHSYDVEQLREMYFI